MTALHCEGMTAGHGTGSPCVRDLDLTVSEGEIVALMGPNGSGKTTSLTTMAGLLPGKGGTVSVGGRRIRSGNARAAVQAGLVLVPDDRALFRRLTTEQNLRLAAPRRGRRSKESIDNAVDHFPALRSRMKVAAGDLSGGEQQMLAIARALVQTPKVLLLDELSMGLAPIVVESILPVLRSVADAGAAVVIVEQHVHLALSVADRAVVLVHGQIVLEADASSLAADLSSLERAYLGQD